VRHLSKSGLLILLIVCLCACSEPPDLAAARAAADQVSSALNSKNSAQFADGLTEDAVLLRENAPAIVGRSQIASLFASKFKELDYALSFKSEEVTAADGVVFDRGSFKGTVKAKDLSEPTAGKYLYALRCRAASCKVWSMVWEFDDSAAETCPATGATCCCKTDLGDCQAKSGFCPDDHPIVVIRP
jgi:ketosteroid isomerase-like protein